MKLSKRNLARINNDELRKRITNMHISELEKLVLMIFDRISTMEDYTEVWENRNLFDAIYLSLEKRNYEQTIKLFEMVFKRIADLNQFLVEFPIWNIFVDKVLTFTALPGIQKYINENNYVGKLVEIFSGSYSFDSAKLRSTVLKKFSASFHSHEINSIAQAVISNRQINESHGALENRCSPEDVQIMKKNIDRFYGMHPKKDVPKKLHYNINIQNTLKILKKINWYVQMHNKTSHT